MDQREYRVAHSLSLESFGDLIGVRKMTVWRYEIQGRVPDPGVMRRIIEISNGEIDVKSYYDGKRNGK